MELSEKLISIQIGGVVAYFGVAFALYKIYIEALKARIDQKDDEIKQLRAQLETPSELAATLEIIQKGHEVEKAKLESEKQEAIERGDKALEKEKTEMIAKITEKDDQLAKAKEQLEEYRQAGRESVIRIDRLIAKLTTTKEPEPPPLSTQIIESSSYLKRLFPDASTCFQCKMSPSKCIKCERTYCDHHIPLHSMGRGLELICGNCVDPKFKPPQNLI